MFSSGWTLDDVLSLTWAQINVVSRCVVSYKAEQANMVLQAISTALGGKVKKPAKPRNEPQSTPDGKTKPKRDIASQLAAMGMSVHDV